MARKKQTIQINLNRDFGLNVNEKKRCVQNVQKQPLIKVTIARVAGQEWIWRMTMTRNIKKRNALFGRYPSCDMLNNALRFIYQGKIDTACAEIIFAIEKAGGYFHADVVPIVDKVKSYWRKQNEVD